MHEARRILEKLDPFKDQGEVNDVGSQRFESHPMHEALAINVVLVKKNE